MQRFKESVLADELRWDGVVAMHFMRQGVIIDRDSPSTSTLQRNFAAMGAKAYMLNLSDNVKRSL